MEFKEQLQQTLEEEGLVLVTKNFIETQTAINKLVLEALIDINSPAMCIPMDFNAVEEKVAAYLSDVDEDVKADAKTPYVDPNIYNGCITRALPIREFGVKINEHPRNPLKSGYSVVIKQLRSLEVMDMESYTPTDEACLLGYFREVKSTLSGEVNSCFTEAGQRWFVEQLWAMDA